MKESPGRRILGIDPGLHILGYGVLEAKDGRACVCEAGIIRPPRSAQDLAARVLFLYNGIVEVIEQFRPEAGAVEELYGHYKHPRTAILMAHARGVVLLAAAQHDLPLASYNATRIKKTIAGNGRASKDQVQRTIQRELGLVQMPEPPDVADALAAALCHFHVQKARP